MDYIQDSVDLMRIIFLLGAVLALIYKKKIGVTPGGIIVPGLLACVLAGSFKAFLLTIATTLFCWIIYKLTLAQVALSKRASSLALIGLSVLMGIGEALFLDKFVGINQEMQLSGLVVPGLIVITAKKYGLWRVMKGVFVTTAATLAAGLALATFVTASLTSYFTTGLGAYRELALHNPLLSFAASLTIAAILYALFKVRSGGYLMAPYIAALIFLSPIQSLMLLAGIIASYLIVRFILAHSLIIGLERFVVSLFCGYFVVSVCDYIAITAGIHAYYPTTLTTIIAVAVITNDLTLQPLAKAIGKGIAPATAAAYALRLVV